MPRVDLVLHRLDELHQDLLEAKDRAEENHAETTEAVKDLANKVAEQNGRIGKIELWRYGIEAVQSSQAWIKPAIIAFITGGTLTAITLLGDRLL